MKTEKFISLFNFAPKSKLKASDGNKEGSYPFYTSSSLISKMVDKAQYYDEALIFGNGGTANIHHSDKPFSTTSHCFVATSRNADINSKYVYYYLFGNIHLLERGFKGVGLKNISRKYIENIDIPILPIETQNKIVSVLDKAESLIKKREETIQLMKEFLNATFFQTFGGLHLNERNWIKKEIGQLCDIQGGLQVSHRRKPNPIEMPYLRVANVFRGYLNLNEIKTIRVTQNELQRVILKKDDILIVEGHGNSYEIGRAALWNSEIDKILHQNHLIRLRVTSPKLNAIFLVEYLNSYPGIYQIKSIVNNTSGLNTISSGKIKSLKIPIPPINIQDKFKEIHLKNKESLSILESSKIELNHLFSSILQKVFNGQLNFNVDFELDALIEEIDLQKKENDLSKISGDVAYLQRLVDKLNDQEFTEKDLYDKAKHALFQLMAIKEDRKVIQEYHESSKSLKLALK